MRHGICYDGKHLFPQPRKFGPTYWQVDFDTPKGSIHKSGYCWTKAGAKAKIAKWNRKYKRMIK